MLMFPIQAAAFRDNEDGFVLVATMVILLVLVVLGISASNTTNTEILIATNDKDIKENFYDQETCLATAKYNYRTWLTTAFVATPETVAFFPPAGGADVNGNGINDISECVDPNGLVIGSFKVRDIEATGTPIAGWEDLPDNPSQTEQDEHPANRFPDGLAHVDKPDPASLGDADPDTVNDERNFEIRRYVITSYSPDITKNAILQEGTFMVFNNFNN